MMATRRHARGDELPRWGGFPKPDMWISLVGGSLGRGRSGSWEPLLICSVGCRGRAVPAGRWVLPALGR